MNSDKCDDNPSCWCIPPATTTEPASGRGRGPSRRSQQDQCLRAQIQQIHQRSGNTYGSPRVHAELQDRGLSCGKKRVERLMRQQGLCARRKRRWVRTTDSRHNYPVAPERLGRQFAVAGTDQIWVADITYVRTQDPSVHQTGGSPQAEAAITVGKAALAREQAQQKQQNADA